MDVVQMETDHPKQFDDSALDRIPTSWEVTNLGNSFDELYRYPTYYGIEYVESGIPEVRGELIKADGNIDENAGNFRYISKETANRFQRVWLEPGDFVMTVRGTMGKIAMVPERLRGAVITANLIRMKFTKSMVVPEWARHFLRSEFFQDALDLATSATTIKTIQVPELCAITFWRPPTKEQRRIAEILDTIDEAIQKTEALISKLKAMKQGLMPDLLTRGLDKNGKLRDPKAHPEQFKDSPLGRIPREWEVVTWGDIVSILTDYTANGSFAALATNVTYLYEGGYARLIRLTDLRQNLLNRDGVYVPQNSYDYLSKSSLFGGEFLLANVGAYAGLVWEMPKVRYRSTLGPNMFLAKFKPECADNVFMIYSASYSFIRQQLDAMASASAQPKLNKTDFRNVMQILPKLNEQKKIVEILESQDMQIISEQKYRDKLKLQKKGLMHDLLTGKVRVKT